MPFVGRLDDLTKYLLIKPHSTKISRVIGEYFVHPSNHPTNHMHVNKVFLSSVDSTRQDLHKEARAGTGKHGQS